MSNSIVQNAISALTSNIKSDVSLQGSMTKLVKESKHKTYALEFLTHFHKAIAPMSKAAIKINLAKTIEDKAKLKAAVDKAYNDSQPQRDTVNTAWRAAEKAVIRAYAAKGKTGFKATISRKGDKPTITIEAIKKAATTATNDKGGNDTSESGAASGLMDSAQLFDRVNADIQALSDIGAKAELKSIAGFLAEINVKLKQAA